MGRGLVGLPVDLLEAVAVVEFLGLMGDGAEGDRFAVLGDLGFSGGLSLGFDEIFFGYPEVFVFHCVVKLPLLLSIFAKIVNKFLYLSSLLSMSPHEGAQRNLLI